MNAGLTLVLKAILGSRISTDILEFLGELIPAVVHLVRQLNGVDAAGQGKLEAAVVVVAAWVDEEMDDLAPKEWRELSEERRDRLVAGLVELVLFVDQIQAARRDREGRRLFSRALSRLRRE